ncbi:MAG: hypothetical protein FIA99_10395 [Ruminiclostridium sp.]|nr:hypothetical protein [Ruminiclostridium sp.]
MYNSEELFIDKFIACLRKLGINSFPFDNEDFYNGIENMQQYFCANRDKMGEYQNELAMLFIKRPLEGVYSEFRNAISKQNGWYIAFENPEYVVASIKLDNNGASYILRQNDLNIGNDYLFEFAKAFCKGAEIPVMSKC